MSSRTHSAYLLYPARAAENRNLPKNKFYQYGKVNSKTRELFVQQVEQITLQYVLAPTTTNLSPRGFVTEFHVFQIGLKTLEFSFELLRCIDLVWHFPVIFELLHEGRMKVVACYKRPNEADADKRVCSDYFETEWLPADMGRTPMPMVLDLGSLYEQVLHALIPLQPRPQETIADLVTRNEQVQAKQCEIARTADKLAREKQFNRKVEVNAELRQLRIELNGLT